ncbi:39S ribosomal protein L15 mitochondrial [Clonorchis sinensis]|uniref:39S ribosomal protein L15 mitochondrial n=1 Tax=Clonorchis sinensis TaxID=79923 RepID=G7YQ93_CLOSI|nr:39S ribosomal protein L15 mitochondrial [Clonorchis sinensis]
MFLKPHPIYTGIQNRTFALQREIASLRTLRRNDLLSDRKDKMRDKKALEIEGIATDAQNWTKETGCQRGHQDAVPYYANAENRGYLADPEELAAARLWLAQKYGYSLTDCASQSEDMRTLMSLRKDPRQIFLGLNPGDLVSLADEVVLKPRLETEQEQNR